MKILLLTLTLLVSGLVSANQNDSTHSCTDDGERNFITESKAFDGDAKNNIKIYYILINDSFDPQKPIVFDIPGGPGGSALQYVAWYQKVLRPLLDVANVFTWDHRGVGCTKQLNGGITTRVGYYGLERASYDIEQIRLDMVSRNLLDKNNFILKGDSYGGILGQQYLVDYGSNVSRAILGVTVTHAAQFNIARNRFPNLVIHQNANVKTHFDNFVRKFPGLKLRAQNIAFLMSYTRQDRDVTLPYLLQLATTLDDPVAAYKVFSPVDEGFAFYLDKLILACDSVYDYPDINHPNIGFFFRFWEGVCRTRKPVARPFDHREKLSHVNIPVLVLGGGQDHVTPIEGARDLAMRLPNSIIYENASATHGIYSDKNDCLVPVLKDFLSGEWGRKITDRLKSEVCTSNVILEGNNFEFQFRSNFLGL